jgi:subtilisin family serine protease
MVVVRTHSRSPLSRSSLSQDARQALVATESVMGFENAGVEVVRCVNAKTKAGRDKVRQSLKSEGDIQFAGRVLTDALGAPVVYTENFFVQFQNNVSPGKCKRLLNANGLMVKRELGYARNAYFVAAPGDTGQDVFKIAEGLLTDETVKLCHPELVRELRHRQAFDQQWHLKKTRINGQTIDAHANVEAAWPLSEGDGVTIAIIDDGVDTAHEEFSGAGKIVFPRDVTYGINSAWPGSGDNHGTACAGVACANGNNGASGVAPKAKLMPIRLYSNLGSQAEADAFVWAADHGADVISCSWGPADGKWWDQNDPQHNAIVALPDSTRLAINYAINNGRNGKGCAITWAAGNGDESVDNDGYASYDKVIAVAACNDRGTKSVYSDYGDANWCAFPSNDFGQSVKTPGIWTTDRSGTPGYSPGDYADDFGGTSSACPGAAGVAALVLARNPELRWDEVKDILKRCCDQIDPSGTSGNEYDANGHSKNYGYGRLNAKTAVELAQPPQPAYTAIHTAV